VRRRIAVEDLQEGIEGLRQALESISAPRAPCRCYSLAATWASFAQRVPTTADAKRNCGSKIKGPTRSASIFGHLDPRREDSECVDVAAGVRCSEGSSQLAALHVSCTRSRHLMPTAECLSAHLIL